MLPFSFNSRGEVSTSGMSPMYQAVSVEETETREVRHRSAHPDRYLFFLPPGHSGDEVYPPHPLATRRQPRSRSHVEQRACLPVNGKHARCHPLAGKFDRFPGPHPGALWEGSPHRSHVVERAGLINQGLSTHIRRFPTSRAMNLGTYPRVDTYPRAYLVHAWLGTGLA